MKNINMIESEQNIKQVFYNDKCDKFDYLIAAGSGLIAGFVDIFFVGEPLNSKLQPWTDEKVGRVVQKFAKYQGWSPRSDCKDSLKSAIGFLERNNKVNYDQRYSPDIKDLFKMSTKNHHMKSLAHSPSPIGLIFSLINQFSSTSTFLSDNKIITIETDTFELKGSDFVSKIFCGFTNWLGHIMSDICGSSGSSGRGSGIVIPFYELLQACNFGSFSVGKHRNTLAKIATKAFEQGYDCRFGITMALPVVINDLLIRLMWSLKHYFYDKRPFAECIPTKRHDDLRVMLIIGNCVLCLMDGVDAFLRGKGNVLKVFLRINLIAWFRLICLVVKEVSIRFGLSRQLYAYKVINQELSHYMLKLQKIDIELFKKESKQYIDFVKNLNNVNDTNDLNKLLLDEYTIQGIDLPYKGEFNEFMSNKSNHLEFQ